MKHSTQLFLMAVCCFFLQNLAAQSISGNLNSATTNNSLGYGNVDIYQGEKLVASVLTDRAGNFNVALDTGKYRCVVNYSGYKTVEKEIHVKKDERADFSIKEDPAKPKRAEARVSGESHTYSKGLGEIERSAFGVAREPAPVSEGLISTGYYGGDAAIDELEVRGARGIPYRSYFTDDVPDLGGQSGALTAGEINDFSKWKMWQDLNETELSGYQTRWNIAPKGRYTVELHTKSGIPLADAIIRLKEHNGNILFTSRTDNTGKAELWLTIKNENPVHRGALSMEVEYQGKKSGLEDVQPFEKTMNHLVLDVTCEQTENVDIAFVVDATGSMGDELSYLQAEMNDIVFQSKKISSKLNFRFANLFYRDLGANELYVTNKMDFNRILSESVDYVSQQSAGGGGDFEEAVEIALDSAINGLSWNKEARARIIFLILDAPPHNTPEIQAKLQKLIAQAAEKGIRIVPVGASGIDKSTEYLMRCLALGTNGTYTFLTDHSGIGNAHIKPSTDRFDVELLNEMLVRILKSYTYMPDCDQQLPDLALNYPDSIVAYPLPDTLSDSIDTNHVIPPDTDRDSLNAIHVKWSYWPNPTDGIVNITADMDITELYVTDLSGKVLQIINNVEKERTIRIDLGEYATGIYLIRYPAGKTWVSGKVILQR